MGSVIQATGTVDGLWIPKGSKRPAEGPHFTWGSIRGSAQGSSEGRLNYKLPDVAAWYQARQWQLGSTWPRAVGTLVLFKDMR